MEMGKFLSSGALYSSGEDLRMSRCGSQDHPISQPFPSIPRAILAVTLEHGGYYHSHFTYEERDSAMN